MSCTYYLRDRKITNDTINKLELLEKEFNSKLNELYEELNKKVSNILPINNEDVMEECRQYEPEYKNETKLYLDPIDKYGNDVGYDKRLEDIKIRYGENSTTYRNAEILISKLRSVK